MFGPDLKDPAILRDLFAVVILGFEELGCKYVPGPDVDTPYGKAAKAYILADAMIAARRETKK